MTGIPFGAPHGGLTDLFFLVLCQDSKSHLQVLARLGRMLQLPEFMARLRETEDSLSAYEIICETEKEIAAQDG
jgi:PTS system nitrogen regulatory IIA component